MYKIKSVFIPLAIIFVVLVVANTLTAQEKPEIYVQVGHSEMVNAVSFSPDGKYVISGNGDLFYPRVKIWDSYTGKLIRSFRGPKGGSKFVTISPDNKYALAFGFHDLKVYDLLNGKEIQTIALSGIETEWAAFSQDSKKVSVLKIGRNIEIDIWDISNGIKIKTINGFNENINPSAANRYFFKDRIIYDGTTGKPARKLKENDILKDSFWDDKKNLVSFSYNCSYAALGTYADNTIILWDFTKGIRRVKKIKKILSKVYISQNGKYFGALVGDVPSCTYNKNANLIFKVWRFDDGKLIGNLTLQKIKNPLCITPSPNLKYLIAGYKDGSVRKFNITKSEEVMTFTSEHYKQKYMATYFDRYLATIVEKDHDWIIWDVHTGTIIKNPNEKLSTPKIMSYINNKAIKMERGRKVVKYAPTSKSSDHKYNAKLIDGTVKLFDSNTGKEVAQFISFKDGEWIVITPEGYFNASPKAAKHLNVRLGNKVYSVDNFYSRFYRPELVRLALTGKKLPKGETIGEILIKKPAPSVEILSPRTGDVTNSENINVTVKVIDNGGGIGSINVYLNGSQVSNDARGITVKVLKRAKEKVFSFVVPLLGGENEIRVVAFNREGSMESIPATVRVTSKAVLGKPSIYAIVVGINQYRNKNISLRYAASDAKAFAETLKRVARSPLFEKIHIKLLTTRKETTKESIQKAFDEIRKRIRPNDIFVFYDASHGVIDIVNETEQYYLLTSNVLLLSSRHIAKDALSQKELIYLIGGIPSQKKLIILDTCHAGKAGKEIAIALLQQTRGLTESTAIKLLQRAVGSAVFSASSDTQQALEGYKGHGLFTYAVIEGLKGDADLNKDGYVKISELQDYVEEKVVTISEQVFKHQQIPVIQTGTNFPIGKIK